jgi:hypothetical protein
LAKNENNLNRHVPSGSDWPLWVAMTQTMTDRELLAAYVGGSEDAFRALDLTPTLEDGTRPTTKLKIRAGKTTEITLPN